MKRLSIFAPAVTGAAGVLLLTAAPCDAATGDKLDQAAVARAMYKGAVTTAMKLKRLMLIGQICGVLSRDEATIIQDNADALIAGEATHLSSADSEWARSYREGVNDGAFRSADPADERSDEACRRFAAPGGPLGKIRTWTDKPIDENGIRLSPRTIP